MTHICKEKVSFYLPLHSHVCTEQNTAQATSSPLGTTSEVRPGWQRRRGLLTQHGRADVHTNPVVTLIGDVIPT